MAKRKYSKETKCIFREMVKLAGGTIRVNSPKALKTLIRTAKANCAHKTNKKKV
jgi:hypothetical protein